MWALDQCLILVTEVGSSCTYMSQDILHPFNDVFSRPELLKIDTGNHMEKASLVPFVTYQLFKSTGFFQIEIFPQLSIWAI